MLDYEVLGAGPPIVLLHAGVADRRMWDDVRGPLAQTYLVVTPDLRGFGRTPLGDEAYSHVDDVVAVLDELRLDRVSLVGASYGGLVALQLAHARPDRVATLVLAAAPLPGWDWSLTMLEFWDAEDAALERGDVDAAVELNVQLWAGADPDVSDRVRVMQRRAFDLQLGRAGQAKPHDIDLAATSVRTLVVVGSRDLDDFTRIADHLVTTMPAATKAVIEGTGHLVAMDQPAQFATLIRYFVD